MRLYRNALLLLGVALLPVACSDIDEQYPEGGSLTKEQSQETNLAIPDRMSSIFSGMFTMMGVPDAVTAVSSGRADNFGFISAALSQDLEGADVCMENSNYNWFSTASEYSTRNANYANPYMRYRMPYNQIGVANEVIGSYPEDTEDPVAINQVAQARAMRAFDYMSLAPYFQFGIDKAADQPCVPILSANVDYSNNPRATVQQVWSYILDDLNYAVEHLRGSVRTTKEKIDQNVAFALRARANLMMGNYAEAAADADSAMVGYTPASIAEVSKPTFVSVEEHNWIWGINLTAEMTGAAMATASSWICAFSGNGYAPYINPPYINVLLYNKIPATDVRKGWWLDENRHSPNWATLTWQDTSTGETATGDEIADFIIEDVKNEYKAYTNIKFGMKSGIGSTTNNNDFPLIRVEEMYLIKAEGLAKSGKEAEGRKVLEDFVKTYRDPSYDSKGRNLSLSDEIWFQRRVELWGEGFFVMDAKRLNKPIVRFHSSDAEGNPDCNFPNAFAFNIAADDPYLNMRFPQTELNNNYAVVDNTGGTQPVSLQNPNLRDGVTD